MVAHPESQATTNREHRIVKLFLIIFFLLPGSVFEKEENIFEVGRTIPRITNDSGFIDNHRSPSKDGSPFDERVERNA